MQRLLTLALIVGCAPKKMERFTDTEVVWVDDDRHPIGEEPEEYWSGLAWDAVDQSLFRPMHRGLSLTKGREAANVNAWDEVPDSSWYVNRIGIRPMSHDELAQGGCPDERLDESGPWKVTSAKPNGANPGFGITDAQGRGWLMKFDGDEQTEIATTADVTGSRLYHAAGFHVPCNIVVFFDRDIVSVGEGATVEDAYGRERPMTDEDIDTVLAAAHVRQDGRLRGSASLFVDGKPIGPWTYQGTRKDDPNDVIPHQDRRELRGAKLMAAWTNHFDSREQNTLAAYVEAGDSGYIRHYYLDFGDTLGSVWWDFPQSWTMRFGHSYYFDATDILVDYLTLGLLNRPWYGAEMNSVAPIGYFGTQEFEPEHWKPSYPNPSFLRMTDEDGAWMARTISYFDDAALQVVMSEGRMENPVHEAEITRILAERRDRILDHYLLVRSPLTEPRLEEGRFCFVDRAHDTGVYDETAYTAVVWDGRFETTEPLPVSKQCVDLGGLTGSYRVVDIVSTPTNGEPLPPLRLHFGRDGDRIALWGIQRPEDGSAPRLKL